MRAVPSLQQGHTHVHDMDLCMGKTCTPSVAWLRWVAKSFRIFL